MNISSIGTLRPWASPSPPAAAKSVFAQTLTAAGGTGAASAPKSATVPGAIAATTAPTPDFTSMSPGQLYSTAQTMYREGKISLDQSFYMQMMAGGVNRNAPAYANQQPVNYVDVFKSQMDGIASRGGAGNADYANYVAILGAIGASGPASPTTSTTTATATAVDTTTNVTPDFTNMTPAQLYSTAQTLSREGKIGPDELFRLDMMAGGVNRDAPAYASTQPVNYVDMVRSQLDGIVSRGGRAMETITAMPPS